MAATTDGFDWEQFLNSIQRDKARATSTTPAAGSPLATTPSTSTGTTVPTPADSGGTDDWASQFSNLINELQGSVSGIVNQDPIVAARKAAAASEAYKAATIPGYTDLVKSAMQNIRSGLPGEVPEDVQNRLAQAAAERGVTTGSRGPGSYLAALGRTSLDQQQTAQTNLADWTKQNTPDTSQFIMTPAQQADLQVKIGGIAADIANAGADRATKLQISREDNAAQLERQANDIAASLNNANLDRQNRLDLQNLADANALQRQLNDINAAIESKKLDRALELEMEKMKEAADAKLKLILAQMGRIPTHTTISGGTISTYDPFSGQTYSNASQIPASTPAYTTGGNYGYGVF